MSKLVQELTQQQLKSVINYIPICGLFLWTHNYPGHKGGMIASRTCPGGYTSISIYGKKYPAHRLAWLYVHGEWPPCQIDHIDGDPSNNRLENLRLATNSQNQQNRKIGCNNTSGVKGVSKAGERFVAKIRVDGKTKHLGTFGTLNEAADAYGAAAEHYFGEYARPEKGEYKAPVTKSPIIGMYKRKQPVDGMSRMCGVKRGPLE